MIRVYQSALRAPVENEPLARAQLLAAHRYRNQHVAIERGRRWAVRLCETSEEVDEAVALVQSATRITRKGALKDLRAARKAAREAHADELARIAELDAEIRRNA